MKVIGKERVSGARVSRLQSAVVLWALAATASISAWLVDVGAPLSPEARRSRGLPASEHLGTYHLSPDVDADDLLCCLSSPMQASDFLSHYGHRIRHSSPFPYARGFRLSLAEFQKAGWRGDCNDYANAICEIGYHHGYPMTIVSMWPSRWVDRLTEDWHQIAVLCIEPDREYLIFEYATPIHWHGTLDEYALSGRKSILPIGGVLDWRPTKRNPIARFLDHLRSNTDPPANHKPLGDRSSHSMA